MDVRMSHRSLCSERCESQPNSIEDDLQRRLSFLLGLDYVLQRLEWPLCNGCSRLRQPPTPLGPSHQHGHRGAHHCCLPHDAGLSGVNFCMNISLKSCCLVVVLKSGYSFFSGVCTESRNNSAWWPNNIQSLGAHWRRRNLGSSRFRIHHVSRRFISPFCTGQIRPNLGVCWC